MGSFSTSDKISMLEAADNVTVDTEGLKKMMGFSVAFDGLDQGFYLPFNHARHNLTEAEQKKVYSILDSRESLIFYNAVHDLRVLARNGFNYRGWFWDPMLMAHWINEERPDYSLDAISRTYGGKPKAMPESMRLVLEMDGWDNVPVAQMDEYSSNDAYIGHRLWRKLLPLFEKEFSYELWEHEQKFIRQVMAPMMEHGIKVDVGYSIHEYMRGMGVMEECIKELGFKPSSRNSLKDFLLGELGLPVVAHTKACLKCHPPQKNIQRQAVHTHSGPPSFDKNAMEVYEEMLEQREDDRAKTILRYRGWQKTTSSNYKPYMNLCDSGGVLHPGYKLHGTRTGRLSCADPNLQQIPKASEKDWNGNLKKAFIPRVGFNLWSVDYSQLQFRMTCAYAGQEELLEIFNDLTRDIFTEMAGQMGWLRKDVKTLVYLILFGGGAQRASVAFGVPLQQGKELVEEFHSLYPEIRKVSKKAEHAAMRQGYVGYWTGRRRHFPRGSAYYRAFNAVIQGGEAEIIKRAMIALAEQVCDENCKLILQIHDEIVFEIADGKEDEYLPRIQRVMESAGDDFCKFVGVKVSFATDAKRWGEK